MAFDVSKSAKAVIVGRSIDMAVMCRGAAVIGTRYLTSVASHLRTWRPSVWYEYEESVPNCSILDASRLTGDPLPTPQPF